MCTQFLDTRILSRWPFLYFHIERQLSTESSKHCIHTLNVTIYHISRKDSHPRKRAAVGICVSKSGKNSPAVAERLPDVTSNLPHVPVLDQT